MATIQVTLDHHMLMRLEALAVLQREALPGLPFEVQDGARQALVRGVDEMLQELLVRSPGVRSPGARSAANGIRPSRGQ